MLQLLVIPICLMLGLLLQRDAGFKAMGPLLLNQLILRLFLPCLILGSIPRILQTYTFDQILYPALMPWLSFVFAMLVLHSVRFLFGWGHLQLGGLVLVVGLGNTSFVGIPLIQALFGSEGLDSLLIVDQCGTFFVANTLATVYAANISEGKFRFKKIIEKLSVYPPVYALGLAGVMALLPLQVELSQVLMSLGLCLPPLAMISAGLQIDLKISEIKKYSTELLVTLGLKMLVFPVLMYLLYVHIFGRDDLSAQVTIVESAMAPMFTSAIIATQFGLVPKLVSLIIFIGVILSVVTVPLFKYILF